ncbi:MAG TPA: Asp-tRNA(Asn)/Glu-tRNA(Gln) amidotransferase subunit GatC [Anaerovoracaceae bacterium]|nr:Asp-tRNA(Asn)/Glu-tRNA(Gln) amidotransferase subunit GatC [Anaerovoracaceae bacterium]
MKITDEVIDYIGELSRLELSSEEKEGAKKDLTDILNYMDKLNELDTKGSKEMTHPFDEANRFRTEDSINGDQREAMLQNAPSVKGDYFKVFKTVEQEGK